MRKGLATMDRPLRVKIAQCLAYGIFFQFAGWLMKEYDPDLRAVKYGGKAAFVMGSVLVVYGWYLFAEARGFLARHGRGKTIAVLVLALVAWVALFRGCIIVTDKLSLNDRFISTMLVLALEVLIFWWADREVRSDLRGNYRL